MSIRVQHLLQELNSLSSQRDHGGRARAPTSQKLEKASDAEAEARFQAVVAKGQEAIVRPSPVVGAELLSGAKDGPSHLPASAADSQLPSLPPPAELLHPPTEPASTFAAPDSMHVKKAEPDTTNVTLLPQAALGEEAPARLDGDMVNEALRKQAASHAHAIVADAVTSSVQQARASADITKSWRDSGRDVTATLKELEDMSSARERSNVAAQSQVPVDSRNGTGTRMAAAPQDNVNASIHKANESGGNFTSLFEAAAVIFSEAAALPQPPQAPVAKHAPIQAPSTIVQRVMGRLCCMRLREVPPSGESKPHFATAALSQDGNELLWTRRDGSWCSLFLRGVSSLTLKVKACAAAVESGSRTSHADACVFQVDLPCRSFAFEAETPYLLQLWVVGLLVLLESSAGALSTVHIWRSLAPQLFPTSAAASMPDHFAFAPSVEHFMQELLQIQASSLMPQKILPATPVAEPVMVATFERRVECAACAAALLLTTVKLVENGLSLFEPDSDVEFAKCDFSAMGITQNSVEFASRLWIEQSASTGSRTALTTPCMLIKDSFGASHLILLPSQDTSSAWEAGVQRAKALRGIASTAHPHMSRPSAELEGGIKALLKSLDFRAAMGSSHRGSSFAEDFKYDVERPVNDDEFLPSNIAASSAKMAIGTTAPDNGAFPTQAAAIFSNPRAREAVPSSGLKQASPMSLPSRGKNRSNNVRSPPTPIEQEQQDEIHNTPLPASHPAGSTQQPHPAHLLHKKPKNESQPKSPIAELLQSLSDSSSASYVPLRAQSQQKLPTLRIPKAIERSPPSPAPIDVSASPSRYGYGGRIQQHQPPKTGVGRSPTTSLAPAPAPAPAPATLSFFSAESQRFVTVVDNDAGGTVNQPEAAALAARINSALASFANFGR